MIALCWKHVLCLCNVEVLAFFISSRSHGGYYFQQVVSNQQLRQADPENLFCSPKIDADWIPGVSSRRSEMVVRPCRD